MKKLLIIILVCFCSAGALAHDRDIYPVENRKFYRPTTAIDHALLSATHSDTLPNAVTRGSLVFGNATPAWDELAISTTIGTTLTKVLGTDGTDSGFRTLANFADDLEVLIDHGNILGLGDDDHTQYWVDTTITTRTKDYTTSGTVQANKLTLALSVNGIYSFGVDGANDGSLAISNTVNDKNMLLRLYANRGDTGDFVGLQIFGRGTSTSIATHERLDILWNPNTSNYEILTGVSGGGTVRSLSLSAGVTNQILLSSTSGLVTFGGNIIIPDDGFIGSVSDPSAIQIHSDGDVTFTDEVEIDSTLGVSGQTILRSSVVLNNLTGPSGLYLTVGKFVTTTPLSTGVMGYWTSDGSTLEPTSALDVELGGDLGVTGIIKTDHIEENTSMYNVGIDDSVQITGSPVTDITGTIDADGTTSIVGIGTKFLTEVEVGDVLRIGGLANRTIIAIASDTELTILQGTVDYGETSVPKYPAVFIVKDLSGTPQMLMNWNGKISMGADIKSNTQDKLTIGGTLKFHDVGDGLKFSSEDRFYEDAVGSIAQEYKSAFSAYTDTNDNRAQEFNVFTVYEGDVSPNSGGSPNLLLSIQKDGLTTVANAFAAASATIGDGTNELQVSATGDFTQAGTAITTLNQLYLNEISTPSAIADKGVFWTNSDNELRFISGDGQNHLVHGSAFSNIWFHGAATPVTISAADIFFKIDTFAVVGNEDDEGNAAGDVSVGNNDITIGSAGAGTYEVAFGASITAAGAARTMVLAAGIEFGTPKTIATATNASPIVIGIVGHPFGDGDMVEIVGCTGNTAANGQWVVQSTTADTFALHFIDGLGNSTGNGAYDADSGSVIICFSGEILTHRKISQNDVGNVYSGGDLALLSGDKIAVYVLNLDAATDLNIFQITLHINREDQ